MKILPCTIHITFILTSLFWQCYSLSTNLMPTMVAVCPQIMGPPQLLRGLVVKHSYFFGLENFEQVVCSSKGYEDPYVKGSEHLVEAKGDEVAKCKENSAIRNIIFFVDTSKILQKFQLMCQELKEEYVVSGEMTTVKNNERNLDCNENAVMAGIEAKRSGTEYVVTAHCQKLSSSTSGADVYKQPGVENVAGKLQ